MAVMPDAQVVLLFDLGNTRLKWRIVSIRGSLVNVLGQGNLPWSEDFEASLGAALSEARVLKPECIWVSSVAGEARELRLVAWCQVHLGVAVRFARATAELGGVVNGYDVPEKLGVDRWLALLAGWDLEGGSCLVVDAGSAITVDLLAGDGRHLGGYIAPGLNLMCGSLFGGTDAVRVRGEQALVSIAPGRSTDSAVAAALASVVCGLLVSARSQLCSQLELDSLAKVRLVLTGGDSGVIAELLSKLGSAGPAVECCLVSDLVFRGLVCWGRLSGSAGG